MQRQLIYFLVFIYGMVTLIALGGKKHVNTVPHKNAKASIGTMIKESNVIRAQKFYGSNYNFAFRFSNNPFSFLY